MPIPPPFRPARAAAPALPAPRGLSRAAAVLLAALFFPGAAAAVEPTGNAVADTFLRQVERAGFDGARAAAVRREADATILESVRGGGLQSGRAIEIGTVRIAGGMVNADNDLSADAIAYRVVRLRSAEGEPTAEIGAVDLSEVTLSGGPPEAGTAAAGEENVAGTAGDSQSLVGAFDAIAITDLSLRTSDGEAVTVARLAAARAAEDEPGIAAGTMAVEDLRIAVSLFGGPNGQDLRALGYETLVFDLSAKGTWEAASGRAVLEEARLSATAMGTIEIAAVANGLTSATLTTLRSAGIDVSQLFKILSTVSLGAVTVRLTDDGITDRLLERAARQAATDRASVSAQIVENLRAPLSALGDDAFARKVLSTVRDFLADPGTVTVSARPREAVSALRVISAAMANPGALPRLLAIEIARR